MKVIDPGHIYDLDWLDGVPGNWENQLQFVKREGEGYPGNVGHHPGTNMQEVIRALIDRTVYLNKQVESPTNDLVICALREALYWLEYRAAKRHGRKPPDGPFGIEYFSTCPKCLHIGCEGDCH